MATAEVQKQANDLLAYRESEISMVPVSLSNRKPNVAVSDWVSRAVLVASLVFVGALVFGML